MQMLKWVRLLGDPARIRMLRVLEKEELSVAELQEILGMGQSRISMQLSQLKQAGFVLVRHVGQKSLYRLASPANGTGAILQETLRRGAGEINVASQDDEGL